MRPVSTIISLLAIVPLVASLACDLKNETDGTVNWKAAPVPAVPLASNGGIEQLPIGRLCGAQLVRIQAGGKGGARFPIWASNDVIDDQVKRVVFVFPGKLRDSWTYFTQIRNARNKAAVKFGLNKKHIAVIAPVFLNRFDREAGCAQAQDFVWPEDHENNDYVWGGLSWTYGGHAKWPAGANPKQTSSFQIVDEIIDYAQKRWKKAERTIIAGHSAGAQAVNHYATMSRRDDSSVHYFTANAGSYLWMTSSRPYPIYCPKANDYKYGLDGFMSKYPRTQLDQLGKKGLLNRLVKRNVALVVGGEDFGPGDTTCMGKSQGLYHRQRAEAYSNSIRRLTMSSDLPPAWSWDIAQGCTHKSKCMFESDPGLWHLFFEGIAEGTDPASRGLLDDDDDEQEEHPLPSIYAPFDEQFDESSTLNSTASS